MERVDCRMLLGCAFLVGFQNLAVSGLYRDTWKISRSSLLVDSLTALSLNYLSPLLGTIQYCDSVSQVKVREAHNRLAIQQLVTTHTGEGRRLRLAGPTTDSEHIRPFRSKLAR